MENNGIKQAEKSEWERMEKEKRRANEKTMPKIFSLYVARYFVFETYLYVELMWILFIYNKYILKQNNERRR